MSVATLDEISEGRAILGLGTSGKTVIENFHGVPYKKPLTRLRDTVAICRTLWRGGRMEPELTTLFDARHFRLEMTPLRKTIPVYVASLQEKAIGEIGRLADGWLSYVVTPAMYRTSLEKIDAAAHEAGRSVTRFGTGHLLFARLDDSYEQALDAAAATLLDPNGRWNDLIRATGTYVSGAELEQVSVRDLGRYDDTGVNWRVVEGYGTVIAAHGASLPVTLGCPVRAIDWSGRRLRVETAHGSIAADAAIVTLPSALLAEQKIAFTPGLPAKAEAAAGLPLGLADKLFLSLSDAGEFEKDSRLFGRTDRSGTATYHLRPFGRPQIEVYFAATLAAELEAAGEAAFLDFAVAELIGLLGSDFARRIRPLHLHRWGIDPLSRGSYSYALPGKADCRAMLAAPVDDRLFFAGEACSTNDYSTAHGAYLTGVVAADQAIAARRGRRPR
jgi:monoamine oxidase